MTSPPRARASRLPSLVFAAIACIVLASATVRAAAPQENEDDRAEARTMLNKGVEAFKSAQFDDAIADFKRAKELDPSLTNAQLYLATACASQYIPGDTSQKNLQYGGRAVQEFREILDRDPSNLAAIDGIGSILYNMASTPFDPDKMEESKAYHEKHILLRPDDPEAYYWVGVIDWLIAYRANQNIRNEYNRTSKQAIRPADPLPPELAVRFVAGFGQGVDEGISNLKKAIELRSDYDDAMAYLNLLYRQKADMQTSSAERDKYMKMADELVDQVLATKRKKSAASQPH